jgi:glutathione peroxidase-family protein
MSDLYRFLKRSSPDMFVPRLGMAMHIYDYHIKFLCNRLGEVKKCYGPKTELSVIEADIKELIKEKYSAEKFKRLIDPPDMFD